MNAREMAADLCALENNELNEWEAKFVDDMTKTLEQSFLLTEKQHQKLEILWKRECAE